MVALVGPEAGRPRAFRVGTLIYLGVGIPQLDRNVADQLCSSESARPLPRQEEWNGAARETTGARTILEADGLDARDGLDDGGLAVGDMADGADVDGGLASNDLGGRRRQGRDVEVLGVGLGRQRRSLDGRRRGYGRLRLGLGLGLRLRFRSAV